MCVRGCVCASSSPSPFLTRVSPLCFDLLPHRHNLAFSFLLLAASFFWQISRGVHLRFASFPFITRTFPLHESFHAQKCFDPTFLFCFCCTFPSNRSLLYSRWPFRSYHFAFVCLPLSSCSRKICFCIPGTPAPLVTRQGRDSFLQDVMELEKLLLKPAFLAAGGEETVDVLVPRLPKDLKARKGKYGSGLTGGESGDDAPISKKAFMRKKATMAAIAVAEAAALAEQAKRAADAARFGASRQLTVSGADVNGMIGQVSCEICFYSEVEGSKGADRMIPCPNCKRLFHRSCLKRWAGNRDLFNWSAWVCGSCRICEVCRRTGEPNKLMFCKRCDGAIHAYCQQPPLKQVPKGPFLCPKHTLCHGCGSRVPGSGVSSRWFLEYTMCDACGRLFIKGKYCSICLKVYRDSEASPMVCCDNCEHWVHARCDAISDEKYYEFQLDNNLRYTCAACRGECYKVKNTSDAVDELWRRRDEADKHLILENQVAAGLPSKEENMKLCPSDDEDENKLPEMHSVKKTVKLLPVKGKDQDEKPSTSLESRKHKLDETDTGGGSGTIKKLKITLPSSQLSKSKEPPSSHSDSSFSEKLHKKKNDSVDKLTKYMMHAREAGNGKSSLADQNVGATAHVDSSMTLDDRDNFLNRSEMKHEQIGSLIKNPIKSVKFVDNTKNRKGTTALLPPPADKKGASKLDTNTRPVLATIPNDVVESQSHSDEFHSDEEGSEGNSDSLQEVRDGYLNEAGGLQNNMEGGEWCYQEAASKSSLPSFKYRDKSANSIEDAFNSEDLDSNDISSGMEDVPSSIAERTNRDATSGLSQDEESSESPSKKVNAFPCGNTASSLKHSNGNTLRGQRSKRRKHPALESQRLIQESSEAKGREVLDDNRALQKLGRDAISTKVEVFCPRNKSWCKGRITDAALSQSHFTVRFDDGKVDTIEFGKRKVRILSHLGKHGRL